MQNCVHTSDRSTQLLSAYLGPGSEFSAPHPFHMDVGEESVDHCQGGCDTLHNLSIINWSAED